MAEQQLVDYIKKARSAGQSDNQSRTLLRQNGWTEAEVNEAFLATNQNNTKPKQPELESQSETFRGDQPNDQKTQHQISGQPDIKIQQEKPRQPESQYSSPGPVDKPEKLPSFDAEEKVAAIQNSSRQIRQRNGSGLILKILVVILLFIIIGVGAYFAFAQGGSIQKALSKASSYFSPKIQPAVSVPSENNSKQTQEIATPAILETINVTAISEDYDVSRITVAAFSQAGKVVVYCAPIKANPSQISCFLNNQKLLDNPFSYKPYWIGMSPDGNRVVFLYYDAARKQSFAYENGKEGTRFNGTITYPVFSTSGMSFAFMVMDNDGKNFIVADGKEFAAHDKIFTPPQFSSDSKYILYGARDGQNMLWVADEINLAQTLGPDETAP
jgi:hypothetical protein